jgi:hypothetical protein
MIHVNFLEMLTWASVNFFTGNLTKVSSLCLAINEVPSAIQDELQEIKNKVFKLHGAKTYLILNIILCLSQGSNL